MFELLCPSHEVDFAYGKPSLHMFNWLRSKFDHQARMHCSMLSRKIHDIFLDFYYELWKIYCNTLKDNFQLFEHQLLFHYQCRRSELPELREALRNT